MIRSLKIIITYTLLFIGVATFEICEAIEKMATNPDYIHLIHYIIWQILIPKFVSFTCYYYVQYQVTQFFPIVCLLFAVDLMSIYVLFENEIPPALVDAVMGDDLLFKPKEPSYLPVKERQQECFEDNRDGYRAAIICMAIFAFYLSFFPKAS